MTTKRPYISCPLWAAVAAKYHGIKLQRRLPSGEFVNENLYETPFYQPQLSGFSLHECMSRSWNKIYIHPDSYDKLKQKGDIGLDASNVACVWDGEEWTQLGVRGFAKHPVVVIKRNGKPFPPIEWEEVA